MKKLCATLLCLALCMGVLPVRAAGPEVNARAALLMEKSTGQVLYEANAHAPLELASVTKVMTMLLIMEALEAGTITKETMVPVSATAAGTKQPIWAMMVMMAVWRIKVDLPAMLGPVMMATRSSFISMSTSLGTKGAS